MKRTIMNCSRAQMARAHDAMIMHNRVFLHEGEFWKVSWIHYGYRHIGIEPAVRRSIDDCTPDEWTRATQNWDAMRRKY